MSFTMESELQNCKDIKTIAQKGTFLKVPAEFPILPTEQNKEVPHSFEDKTATETILQSADFLTE